MDGWREVALESQLSGGCASAIVRVCKVCVRNCSFQQWSSKDLCTGSDQRMELDFTSIDDDERGKVRPGAVCGGAAWLQSLALGRNKMFAYLNYHSTTDNSPIACSHYKAATSRSQPCQANSPTAPMAQRRTAGLQLRVRLLRPAPQARLQCLKRWRMSCIQMWVSGRLQWREMVRLYTHRLG